ncbi:hypothetical protein L873DRAFT_461729 [Choiromyces venosus 120613-1]|uniref:Uncharacterized protein n=1 Tax=Choiromyces venosus 120613-1 TaxID=1336337 RepID=A0A3N4JZC4_9PEZI|nr:hypothetical protein L873DRAFT_461729 [Choiromyces venosus 120613-1]
MRNAKKHGAQLVRRQSGMVELCRKLTAHGVRLLALCVHGSTVIHSPTIFLYPISLFVRAWGELKSCTTYPTTIHSLHGESDARFYSELQGGSGGGQDVLEGSSIGTAGSYSSSLSIGFLISTLFFFFFFFLRPPRQESHGNTKGTKKQQKKHQHENVNRKNK